LEAAALVVLILCLLIIAAVVVIGMGIQSRRQIREMEHRERLAMIERGLTPAIDLDSAAEERSPSNEDAARHARVLRWRTAGIMMIGLGLAEFFLVTFTVNAEIGIGVGGALAVIGAAFFANAMMLQKSARTPVRRAEPRIPPSSTREG
jgi:hypothetical protein